MKKLFSRFISLSLLSLLLIGSGMQNAAAQDASVSYQAFYDDLAPYGQWVNDPQYGNVWVPNEPGDFRPYETNGYWVMTGYGNTWVSDDPWGWACYHYGRWTYDPYYGWVWIPGYEWAPAWVSWRYGGGYCGWAPLGPGAGIAVGYNCPDSWWVFVGPQYLYSRDFYRHWDGPAHNGEYIHRTAFVNNAYVDNHTHVRYNYGPSADVIQRDTHQPVQVYHVSQAGRPGAPGISGDKVSMYRPAVNRATVSSARPSNVIAAPRQIGSPHAATNVSAAKQPAFSRQMQNHTVPNAGAGNTLRHGNTTQPQNGNRPQRQQTQPQQRPQSQPRPQQQRPQPMPQQRPQPMPQPRQQPMPQPRPMPQQRPMEAPHEEPRGGGERR